jgi:tetratricopeptide (TPR) repeat protein
LKIILAAPIAALIAALAAPVAAQGLPPVRTYQACLDRTDRNANAGREAAAEWKRFGGGAPARICEALALSSLGAHAAAARALDEAAATSPDVGAADRAEMLALAAQFWLTAGEGAQAEASADAALTLAPGHDAAHRVRGVVRLATERYAAAADDLSVALRGAPDDPLLWTARARARAGMFDPAGAAEDARHALTLAPGLAEALLQKGLAEVALRDAPAARDSLMAAIRADGPPPGGDVAVRARAAIQQMALGE